MPNDEDLPDTDINKAERLKKTIQQNNEDFWYYLTKIPIIIPFVIPISVKKKK